MGNIISRRMRAHDEGGVASRQMASGGMFIILGYSLVHGVLRSMGFGFGWHNWTRAHITASFQGEVHVGGVSALPHCARALPWPGAPAAAHLQRLQQLPQRPLQQLLTRRLLVRRQRRRAAVQADPALQHR